jgi:cell wall assembly regulator SMI1
LKLRRGATESEIQRFERGKSVLLPADFRAFIRASDGMEIDVVDPDTQIRFWSLFEIRSVAEELGEPRGSEMPWAGFFVFADYSVWAHGYAIRLTDDPHGTNPVVIVGGDIPIHVATSFSHFLEKYVEDARQVI